MTTKYWAILPSLPVSPHSFVIAIDGLNVPSDKIKKGLYSYNTIHNEWTLLLKLTKIQNYSGNTRSSAFNPQTSTIYFINKGSELAIYNMKTNKCIKDGKM